MHSSYQNKFYTNTEGGEGHSIHNYSQLFSEQQSMNKSTCEIAESLRELNINKRYQYMRFPQTHIDRTVNDSNLDCAIDIQGDGKKSTDL